MLCRDLGINRHGVGVDSFCARISIFLPQIEFTCEKGVLIGLIQEIETIFFVLPPQVLFTSMETRDRFLTCEKSK